MDRSVSVAGGRRRRSWPGEIGGSGNTPCIAPGREGGREYQSLGRSSCVFVIPRTLLQHTRMRTVMYTYKHKRFLRSQSK